MKVLNFGSLNIDYVYKVDHIVKRGETISSESLNLYSGGKGLNQSVALGKAGAEVFHAGAIGEDGSFLVDILKDAGVNTDCVSVLSDVRTGNAIIQNDKDGDNCIILYGGANQAIEKDQIDKVLSGFEREDLLILQNEINNLGYIVERAHEAGMKIVLNPSPMDDKIRALPLEYIDYFILNEIEAAQILGECGNEGEAPDGEALIAKLSEKFPHAAIVLTLGSEGSVYSDGETMVRQPIFKVKAVDTTAAGDTFTGYFFAELTKGGMSFDTIKTAMQKAAAASAIAVSRQGAAPSIPMPDEVEEFIRSHS